MTETHGIASLSMYDWPEVRTATDVLWSAITARLLAQGIAAPDRLDRDTAREEAWVSPELVMAQTCGLPFMRSLKGKVVLLGSPIYHLEHDQPGDYCSLLVARSDDEATRLEDFRGRRVAFNGADSQSGYVALQCVVAPLAIDGRFFAAGIESGGHRQSLVAVANDQADIAAIDAVSWQLALDHEPAAKRLKVVAETPLTPGLPYITALANAAHRGAMIAAISAAIDALDPAARDRLKITGFRPRAESEYGLLLRRLAAAEAAGYPRLA